MTDSSERTKLVLLGGAAVVCAVAVFLAKDALKPPAVSPGAPAPAAAKKMLPAGPLPVSLPGGGTRDLAQRTGKGLILHFWATWCAPCREEMPDLVKFVKETKGDPNVEFLAVSADDDWDIAQRWLRERGIDDLPLALDARGPTSRLLGATGYPETFFVAPSGEIVRHEIGAANWSSPKFRAFAAEFSKAAGAGKS